MSILNKLKFLLRPIVFWIMKSNFYVWLSRSQGDWKYFYISFIWWITSKLLPRRKISVENITFTLQCDNWITHFRWYLFHKKEKEVRHYIDNYLRDDDIFFDIGANIGVFSIYAAKRYSNINIYAFEPEYSNLHYLKENIIKNRIENRTFIYSIAVSDTNGISRLHVQDLTPGAAVHTESKKNISRTDEGYEVIWREGVAIKTLDSLSKDINEMPNGLKIDTDGNELKILRGASKVLTNKKLRSIIIEMPPSKESATQCSDILNGSGFQLDWSNVNTRNQIWIRKN